MKKLFLLVTAFALSLGSACAQNASKGLLKKSPLKMESKSLKAPRRDVSLDETSIWGYYTGDIDGLMAVGTGQTGTFSVAMKVPGTGVTEGASICGINLPIYSATNMSKVTVFVTKSLTASPDVEKAVDKSALVNQSYVPVALDEEYTIPAEGVYVGYSFEITRVQTQGDQYPILTDGVSTAQEQLWLKMGSGAFEDYSGEGFGASGLQLYLKGMNLNEYDVTPYGFDEVTVVLGEDANADITLVNQGSAGITSIAYTVATGTVDADFEQELTLPTPVVGFNARATVSLPLPTDAVTGQTTKTITITKVNGQENASVEKSCTGTLFTVSKLVARTVAVEELTGTGCPWCPRGLAGMEKMRDTFGDQFVGLGIHQYNSSDAMYLSPSTYARLSFPGAPNCMINRSGDPIDPYYGSADDICDDVRKALAVPAKAGVEVAATWNEDKTAVDAVANVETTVDNVTYTVEFALVADQLSGSGSAWNQSNNYAQYTVEQAGADAYLAPFCRGGAYGKSTITGYKFNDVIIAGCYINNKNPLPALTDMVLDQPQSVECTLKMPTKATLKNAIDPEQVYAVAMVIDSEGHIANAAKVKVETPETVTGISTAAVNTTEKVSYNLNGVQLAAPQQGVNIVRMANGQVKKVVIK